MQYIKDKSMIEMIVFNFLILYNNYLYNFFTLIFFYNFFFQNLFFLNK